MRSSSHSGCGRARRGGIRTSPLAIALAGALSAAAASGCGTPAPLGPAELAAEPRELLAIHAAFEAAIAAAEADPVVSWHSGRLGNLRVNVLGGDHAGLCWHWQELVFRGVAPVAADLGWAAVGIGLNVGRSGEHHAVLVYDPRATTGTGYVLDAWRRGRPDIYRLGDWIAVSGRAREEAELEELR